MIFLRWSYALLAALALYLATIQPAGATAFAGVDRAFWLFSIDDPLAVLDVDYDIMSVTSSTQSSGSGFAETDFVGTQFSDTTTSHSLFQSGFGRSLVVSTGFAATILDVIGVINVTNTTAFPIELNEGNTFVNISAFNPGGNSIGASVDNPQRESALFNSAAGFDFFGPDLHGCETSLFVTECGVGSPDDSASSIGGVLEPFGTMSFNTILHIETQARALPEPASLSLIGLGLIGLIFTGGLRLRQSADIAS